MRVGSHILAVVLCAAGQVLGCAGDLQQPERFALGEADCANDPVGFVRQTCTDATCHQPDNTQQTVDLVSPGYRARLVDVRPSLCTSQLLIDSANPANSFLLDKLNTRPTCGAQMPFFRPPLSSRQRACVATFVDLVLSGAADADGGIDAGVDAGADAGADAN